MIRLAEYEDLEGIAQLMYFVFQQKLQDSYSDKGRSNFLELISLSSLQKRFLSQSTFFISVDEDNIEAMIEIEEPCHIAFLFSKIENRGLARSLCEYALNEQEEEICTVGSVKGAIGFYKKLGFIQVGDETIAHDMSFTLMAKSLK